MAKEWLITLGSMVAAGLVVFAMIFFGLKLLLG